MKCVSDQFQLCFFAMATLNSYIYFCIGNTIVIFAEHLLVAIYALSCLWIPVSNALENEYSVMLLLSPRCGNVVILTVFKTGINAVSFLCVFYAVFSVFLTAQWRLRHTGSSGLTRVFDYELYQRTQACLLCIFVSPPTVPIH